MVNDNDPIASSVHIQLDRVRSSLERPSEGGERVLWELGSGAAVGDSFDGHCSSGKERRIHEVGLTQPGRARPLVETFQAAPTDLDLNGATPVTSTVWTE